MFRFQTGFSVPKYDDPEESQDVPQENSVFSDRIPGTCQTGEKFESFAHFQVIFDVEAQRGDKKVFRVPHGGIQHQISDLDRPFRDLRPDSGRLSEFPKSRKIEFFKTSQNVPKRVKTL